MQHALIIRPGAVGDTLLTLPVLQELKERFQPLRCSLVGNASVLPLALASGIVDETFDYEQSRWGQLFSTRGITDGALRELLSSFDLVICWLRDPEGIVARNLIDLNIPQVIVAPGRPSEEWGQHVVEYLVSSLGLDLAVPDLRAFRLNLPSVTPSGLPMPGRDGKIPNVAIHYGSGGARKCWPVAYFGSLIKQIWRLPGSVSLVSGPAEQDRLSFLLRELPVDIAQDRLNLLVHLTLLDLARNIQMCNCFVGNDSGITHLAAMLGVPTLALFGPSNPDVWHPTGRSVVVLHEPVLEDLQVDEVIAALIPFIS